MFASSVSTHRYQEQVKQQIERMKLRTYNRYGVKEPCLVLSALERGIAVQIPVDMRAEDFRSGIFEALEQAIHFPGFDIQDLFQVTFRKPQNNRVCVLLAPSTIGNALGKLSINYFTSNGRTSSKQSFMVLPPYLQQAWRLSVKNSQIRIGGLYNSNLKSKVEPYIWAWIHHIKQHGYAVPYDIHNLVHVSIRDASDKVFATIKRQPFTEKNSFCFPSKLADWQPRLDEYMQQKQITNFCDFLQSASRNNRMTLIPVDYSLPETIPGALYLEIILGRRSHGLAEPQASSNIDIILKGLQKNEKQATLMDAIDVIRRQLQQAGTEREVEEVLREHPNLLPIVSLSQLAQWEVGFFQGLAVKPSESIIRGGIELPIFKYLSQVFGVSISQLEKYLRLEIGKFIDVNYRRGLWLERTVEGKLEGLLGKLFGKKTLNEKISMDTVVSVMPLDKHIKLSQYSGITSSLLKYQVEHWLQDNIEGCHDNLFKLHVRHRTTPQRIRLYIERPDFPIGLATADAIHARQAEILINYRKTGVQAHSNSNRLKGNLGEIKQDYIWERQKAKALHRTRVVSLEDPTHYTLDHVFDYKGIKCIIESKIRSLKKYQNCDINMVRHIAGKQVTPEYIDARLEGTVGYEMAQTIRKEGCVVMVAVMHTGFQDFLGTRYWLVGPKGEILHEVLDPFEYLELLVSKKFNGLMVA